MQWRQSVLALLLTISPTLAIWPAPVNITTGNNALWLEDNVLVTYNGYPLTKGGISEPSSNEQFLYAGVQRTLDNIFHNSYVPWKFYGRNALESTEPSVEAKRTYIRHLNITLGGIENNDESYELTITDDGSAAIEANSTLGVLHGLETFSQFFAKHSKGGIYTIQAPIGVSDKPMYEHRGVSLDVSRSYYKVDAIYRTLDAMSWNKLNRLHIHVTDAQSWPLEIPSIPSLSNVGSYSPETVYTTTDIENIQKYGSLRGIEVYFEIDTPGHTSSIAFSHPELIAAFEAAPYILYCNEPPCGTLRLNDSAVDTFLDKLMGDLLPRLSPYSSYFHTGGDEVKYNAYTLDPTVGTNNSDVINELLQRFYNKQHARVRTAGMTPMVWEEVPLNYNVSIGSDVVVQTWLSADSVKAVTSMGNRVIDSGYDYWYLDCGRGNFLNFNNGEDYQINYPFPSWCDPFKNWILVYSHDPSAGLTMNESSLVLGGEVAVWSESIDDVTLDSLLWPRASAAGEVLWSGRIDPATGQNRSEVEASIRLSQFRETMVARGVGASLVVMPFCTQGMNGTICEVST